MKHQMIATKAFPYARRALKVDDEFEALDDKDSLILEGLGKARRVDAIEPRGVKASDDDKPERTNRRYRRRDLQAEG